MNMLARAALALSALLACAPAMAQYSAVDERGQPLVQAGRALTGTLSAPGQSAGQTFRGDFNVTLVETGGSATCGIDRSFDGGTSWVPTTLLDQPLTLTTSSAISTTLNEPEAGVLRRLNCSAVTGSLAYRLSQ